MFECRGPDCTVFTGTHVQVAFKYKMHPNFYLDFLARGHIEMTVISYPCTHPKF